MEPTADMRMMEEVKQSLNAVATQLQILANESTATRTELREVKDRVLDRQNKHEVEIDVVKADLNSLKATVSGIQSRQAPLATPAAWGALIISGLVAAKQMFGF